MYGAPAVGLVVTEDAMDDRRCGMPAEMNGTTSSIFSRTLRAAIAHGDALNDGRWIQGSPQMKRPAHLAGSGKMSFAIDDAQLRIVTR